MPRLLAVFYSTTLSMHGMSGPIHQGPFLMPAVCHNHLTDNTLRWHYLKLFSLLDAGHTVFRVVRLENNALLADVTNVDGHGKETQLVQLFGRYDIL